jgi:hypothetical protein
VTLAVLDGDICVTGVILAEDDAGCLDEEDGVG